MCMSSPKPPTVNQVVTPPPAAAPQPMASPDEGSSLNLSQLRIGSKNNLKLRAIAGPVVPSSGLTIPSAPSQSSAP